ncbi:hypothetical protein PybrP1_009438 [[Pythium] brassicae (nom. inval.)]|nr:hypothetical protein PybrP1_009438 [[Pythium] brassicae (nom. inval.)]
MPLCANYTVYLATETAASDCVFGAVASHRDVQSHGEPLTVLKLAVTPADARVDALKGSVQLAGSGHVHYLVLPHRRRLSELTGAVVAQGIVDVIDTSGSLDSSDHERHAETTTKDSKPLFFSADFVIEQLAEGTVFDLHFRCETLHLFGVLSSWTRFPISERTHGLVSDVLEEVERAVSPSRDTIGRDTHNDDIANGQQADSARTRATSTTTATGGGGGGGGGGSGGMLEQLHEELQLELVPPRKLLRQFSLNVPPSSASLGAAGASPSAFRSAVIARKLLSHASPTALGGVLERWERNQLRWRRHSSSELGSSGEHTPHSPLGEQQEQQQEEEELEDREDAGSYSRFDALAPPLAITFSESGSHSTATAARPDAMGAPFVRHETLEVRFGHGFLGVEFAVDEARGEVVVKSVQPDAPAASMPHSPPLAKLARGLIVDAVDGRGVGGRVPPAETLELLRLSARPMVVRFRKARDAIVVCKLCECTVDATALGEHTNYCVMSKRFELEADQINSALTKLARSIDTNLHADALRTLFHPEDLHFYNALRVVAIQQEPATSSFAVERGLKFCAHLRNLIHAKMSKMRATQKAMLQQAPSDPLRAPIHRTKSLEEKEPLGAAPARGPARRRLSACRVSIRDFQIAKPISKGAYGKVYLARKKTTGDQYAIKVLAKEHLLRKKQKLESIETERDILVNIESPYVVKLFWTFQSRRNLFLVMEYLPGGDFMSLLECIVQLEEQVARVYIAEVALALNHLHSKGCVHRDLKPDNILISSTGHIKLTDFGLSEEAVVLSDSESETAHEGFFGELDDDNDDDDAEVQVVGSLGAGVPKLGADETPEQFGQDENISAFFDASRPPRRSHTKHQTQSHAHTFGRCGTPDYLSPEIILGVPHGPPVDYWALGVILYEMLVGFPPFNDDTVEAIFNNILERQILWPDGEKCLSPDAIDLISKLLEPDPALRLGWEGLRSHRFFDGIDWDTLLDSVPPFVPTLEDPNDTSYFNNRNLTDIFIDDDDFEFDAKSVDSSSVLDAADSTDQLSGSSGDKGSGDGDAEPVGVAAGALDQAGSDAASEAVGAGGTERAARVAPSRVRSDGGGGDSDSAGGSDEDDDENGGDSSSNRFPSGMYGSPDETVLTGAFRSFSFTNMNALAAASRTEAERVITDSLLLDAESSSVLSILI